MVGEGEVKEVACHVAKKLKVVVIEEKRFEIEKNIDVRSAFI